MLPIPLLEHLAHSRTSIATPTSLSFRRFFSSSRRPLAASTTHATVERSYTDTIKLPKTPFPLRADAVNREKLFRGRTTTELYAWQAKQVDRPMFVLHDGPPYANGNLHTGHFMNKTLKDLIVRSKLIQGYRVHYVPGYDTHGLPLELKALATINIPRDQLTPQEIRAAARKEAEGGVELQGGEFREFGGLGAFGRGEAYRTLDWSYEKRQLEVFTEMVKKGLITTHHRPTLYSPSSGTALAEAELEYNEEHVSRSVYVDFPVAELGGLRDVLASVGVVDAKVGLAVWTTTAWTLPSNVAIAVSETMEYSLVRNPDDGALLVVATERAEHLCEVMGVTLETLATFPGSTLLQTTFTSPLFSSPSFQPARPIFSAPYVTSTTGTGLVHTAPAHGVEDWEAFRAYQLARNEQPTDSLCAVDGAGKFSDVLESLVEKETAGKLVGKEVLYAGTKGVIELLTERGALLKEVRVKHKFPYDWRTKKPVIYRASSQWFANVEAIKEQAVAAINEVDFYPSKGRTILEQYVRGRSEWCISRQRPWGVPIPVVYSYPANTSDPISSSTPYLTPSNVNHIISVLESKATGTDYWWEGPAEEFVEPAELERSRVEGRAWRKGTDTMDVWFDSGTSWSLIKELDLRPSTGVDALPLADVYLEGTDQHRGWFQSSLLTAIAASGAEVPKAPYGTVITHGMVLDEAGRKMSKSLGNVISPLSVIYGGENKKKEPAYGADLLRVWVASVEYTRDVPIGPTILAQTFEGMRKIRNTARFLLGTLAEEPVETVPEQLGLVDRYMLHELYELDRAAREGYNSFAFNRVYQALTTFSNTTLSAFYFNITKDCLYADASSSPQRRAIIYTLQQIFDTYVAILAPMAPHLAEEIQHFALGHPTDPKAGDSGSGSVFEKVWKPVSERWKDEQAKKEMEELFVVRDEVMGLLELARTDKNIRSSAEATVVISNASNLVKKHAEVLSTLFVVSEVHVDPAVTSEGAWTYNKEVTGMTLSVLPAEKLKCPRCRTHSRATEEEDVCGRCSAVLSA
ncbi:isoleucyl-trna synthetase [Pseudohyphozyma bogoriensis]|nr:isoleucyl-trna synthetase [Pseudohyphozyma bogoriensis]